MASGKRTRSQELPTEVMTIQVEGLPAEVDDDYRRAIERHRRTALKYLKAGNLSKGFGELVRASRAGPMTPRLAAYLAALGPSLGNPGGAARLLEGGSHDVAGKDRVRVLLRLVRLLRKTGQEAKARNVLREVLEQAPLHAGAHRVMQGLHRRTQDWEGLDAALAAQCAAAESAHRPLVAGKAELGRAKLWSDAGGDLPRAARAYHRASLRFAAAKDLTRALQCALAELETLEESAAPREAVVGAVRVAVDLAERAGDVAQLSLLRKRLAPPPEQSRRRRSTGAIMAAELLSKGGALDADAYQALGSLYARQGDEARADQMEEVAVALRGKSRAAQPAPPALYLTAADRAGLRHPHLRNAAGELLAMVGLALCRVAYLAPDRSLSTFRVTDGRGSPAIAEALLASVRILGIPAPQLEVAARLSTPVAPDYLEGLPHLLIARRSTKQLDSPALLRFFAGRALFAQSPDLLALLLGEADALSRAFELLGAAIVDTHQLSREARGMSQLLHAKGRERLRELHEQAAPHLNVVELKEAALHSANRAGLVVCGALGPALASLQLVGAPKKEQEELVRFAASPRYLALRTRRDAPGPGGTGG